MTITCPNSVVHLVYHLGSVTIAYSVNWMKTNGWSQLGHSWAYVDPLQPLLLDNVRRTKIPCAGLFHDISWWYFHSVYSFKLRAFFILLGYSSLPYANTITCISNFRKIIMMSTHSVFLYYPSSCSDSFINPVHGCKFKISKILNYRNSNF